MRGKITTDLFNNNINFVKYQLGNVTYQFYFFVNARNNTLGFDLINPDGSTLFQGVRFVLTTDLLGYRNINDDFIGTLLIEGDEPTIDTIDNTSTLIYDDGNDSG